MSDLIERTMQIDTDEQMGRHYIPVTLDWEIQTKGKGSSFRIAQRTEDGNRWIIGDSYLHKMIEQMARDVNADSVAKDARIAELEVENTTLLDLHSKAMKSLTSQVLKRRELEAALEACRHEAESSRTWNGQGWTYNGYHIERVHAIADKALEGSKP